MRRGRSPGSMQGLDVRSIEKNPRQVKRIFAWGSAWGVRLSISGERVLVVFSWLCSNGYFCSSKIYIENCILVVCLLFTVYY